MTKRSLVCLGSLAALGACTSLDFGADGGLAKLSGPDASHVYALGTGTAGDTVFRVDDGGASTSERFAGEELHDLVVNGPSDVWVVGTAVHHYDGLSWSTIAMPADPIFGLGHGVAVGVHGTVYRTDARLDVIAGSDPRIDLDGGIDAYSWSDASGNLWITDGARVFALAGAAWSDVTPPGFASNDTLEAIGGTGADDVWVFAFSGTAYHFDGSTWTAHDAPSTDALVNGISATSPDDVWAVGALGQDGLVLHYDGTAWTTVALPPAKDFGDVDDNGVIATGANDVWITGYVEEAVGGAPLLYHFDGSSWSDESP